jgi:hypothetical protein
MQICTTLVLGFLCLMAGAIPLSGQTSQQADAQKKSQAESQAQEPDLVPDEITAVPNRPTFANTALTVQRGVFEVEYGFEAAGGHQNINGLLKWGVLRNLELWFLNNPIERDAGVAGLGDSGAGFKYKIFSQARARPVMGILYVATLPTAGSGLGAVAFGHSVILLLSKDFGKHHFDFNEGVEFVGRAGAAGFDRNHFTALAYSFQSTAKWGYTGEIAGFSRTNAVTPATMTLLGAATYNLSPRLVLDAGAYFAVYGNLPRATFFAGVTYSVADLYHLHRTRRAVKH